MTGELPPDAEDELRRAKLLLESDTFANRLMRVLGEPLERGLHLLPARGAALVSSAVRRSLDGALRLAAWSLPAAGEALAAPGFASTDGFHDLAVTALGAGGGFFGLLGLPLELPVTTTLMLRSIAEIARREGESPASPGTRLACLEVLGLGARPGAEQGASYLLLRNAIAKEVGMAATYLASGGAVDLEAPAIVRFIAKVAERFGVAVTERAAAMAVPVIGAAGGAFVNHLFIDHYQKLARGHFTVRRLERTHGEALVRAAYARL
ncbi:MAG: EcsC family protein [Deltaproteobacteria bacterium]